MRLPKQIITAWAFYTAIVQLHLPEGENRAGVAVQLLYNNIIVVKRYRSYTRLCICQRLNYIPW